MNLVVTMKNQNEKIIIYKQGLKVVKHIRYVGATSCIYEKKNYAAENH